MKKSILFVAFSLIVTTLSFSQWEKIAQMDDNLEELFQLGSTTTIATGNNTTIYNLNSPTPSEIASQLSNFGFITSSLYINENESYIGGGCYFPFDECPANTLHKTIDGGETWQQVITEATFTGTGNIFGIIPINETELILISDFNKLTKVNISTGTATPYFIPGTEDANNFTLGKVSQSGKWLVAASFYDVVLQNNTIKYYESDDKGVTWSELDTDIDNSERILFIDYLPTNNLAAVSNKGKTYNIIGGIISPINIITDAYIRITAQYVINNSAWYIASFDPDNNESRLHLSEDGGESWNIETEFGEGSIGNLSFKDINNGFLVYNNKEVYKRTGPNTTINQDYSAFTISPNPAKDVLNINADFELQDYSIDIIDAMGRKAIPFRSAKYQYDVSGLASGFYQLLLIDTIGKVVGRESFMKG
ncbi:MAG: hypothetical protein ACJATI_000733 [Halioglobus sp.]|jgi:hypothetical protein